MVVFVPAIKNAIAESKKNRMGMLSSNKRQEESRTEQLDERRNAARKAEAIKESKELLNAAKKDLLNYYPADPIALQASASNKVILQPINIAEKAPAKRSNFARLKDALGFKQKTETLADTSIQEELSLNSKTAAYFSEDELNAITNRAKENAANEVRALEQKRQAKLSKKQHDTLPPINNLKNFNSDSSVSTDSITASSSPKSNNSRRSSNDYSV